MLTRKEPMGDVMLSEDGMELGARGERGEPEVSRGEEGESVLKTIAQHATIRTVSSSPSTLPTRVGHEKCCGIFKDERETS